MTYHRARIAVLLTAAAVLLISSAFGARDVTVRTRQVAAHGVPAGGATLGAKATPSATATKPGGTGRDSQRDPRPSGQPSSAPPTSTPPTAAGTQKPNSLFGPAGSARLTGTQAVALTFDDGPDPINTPKILDLLAKYNVKATFCVVGFRARDHPDLIKRIADEGHTLCNHSWQHLFNLAKRPADYINWDLTETNRFIQTAAPGAQVKYFRAPGGNFTAELVAKAASLGMASIYWAVDPRDWEHKEADDASHIAHVINMVKNDTKAGSIVLSHDNGQPDTIIAYDTLLPWLKDRFTLEALPI